MVRVNWGDATSLGTQRPEPRRGARRSPDGRGRTPPREPVQLGPGTHVVGTPPGTQADWAPGDTCVMATTPETHCFPMDIDR